MANNISILDHEYLQWIKELGSRYRMAQLKAAVKVNQEVIRFYWQLGRDIKEMHIEERWGEKVIRALSSDLQRQIPNAQGLSIRNIYYCKLFYKLYSQYIVSVPQVVGRLGNGIMPQPVAQLEKGNLPRPVVLQSSTLLLRCGGGEDR